jgi:hypothetical protein
MAKAHHIRWLFGCLVFAWAEGTALLGNAVAAAVPYPLPPGYLSSYDQGYATMAALVGSKYFFTPSSQLRPPCYEELRIAQSETAPENADGFVAGCTDAARHAMGIYYPCDRFGDDPVCPRRP